MRSDTPRLSGGFGDERKFIPNPPASERARVSQQWSGAVTARCAMVACDMARSSSHRSSAGRRRRPRSERGDPEPGGRYTRAERVRQIKRLEQRGQATREIATELGLAVSTVNIYRADPTGERQRERRRRYRGECRGCGRPTSGSGGRKRAPEWCRRCAGQRRQVWTGQRVLDAIRDWAELTGAPPGVADWSPAHARARDPGSARYRSQPGRWPSASVVAARFGSFRRAVEGAGLTGTGAREPGAPSRWGLEEIAAAMRRHAERTGAFPRRSDWHRAGRDHPAASTVYRVAGSWGRAVEAGAALASACE
jgi:transposase